MQFILARFVFKCIYFFALQSRTPATYADLTEPSPNESFLSMMSLPSSDQEGVVPQEGVVLQLIISNALVLCLSNTGCHLHLAWTKISVGI